MRGAATDRTGSAGRPVVLGGWWVDAALCAAAVAVTVGVASGALLGCDLAVRDWLDQHRVEALRLAARGLNFLGSARPLAVVMLALALPLVVRRRSVRPVLPVVAAYALSYLVVGPIKYLGDRSAPHATGEHVGELLADPSGWSYPSGHVINAIVWYQVGVVLLGAYGIAGPGTTARRVLRVGPPLVVSLTVTYLQFHWVTDTLAGIALGLVLDRLLGRIPWSSVPLGGLLAHHGWDRPISLR